MSDIRRPLSLNERANRLISQSQSRSAISTAVQSDFTNLKADAAVNKVKIEAIANLAADRFSGDAKPEADSAVNKVKIEGVANPAADRSSGDANLRAEPVVNNINIEAGADQSADGTNLRAQPVVNNVKIEGRRRLCKQAPASDPEEQEPENISDILDDLSSRLDELSVEKSKLAPPRRSNPDDGFKSASSVLSSDSSNSSRNNELNEPKHLFFDEFDEEDEEEEAAPVVDVESDEEVKDDEVIRFTGFGKCKSKEYVLPCEIAKILYPHQRDGLTWLWSLHCNGTGGILGDDMGLGKTMQISAYLAGLFQSHLVTRVLIVAPKTLLSHWNKELTTVGLSAKIRDYSGTSAKLRQYELDDVFKYGGILLTTYDIVRNNSKSIRGDSYFRGARSEEDLIWDYTILDEGHIIKNPKTQRAQSLLEIPCPHRIVISGTPIQNNLKELWALFHFCCPELLGDKDEFKIRYESAILRGNDKHASDREKHVGSAVAKALREQIKPYFLRRMKSEVFQEDNSTKNAKLSRKSEIIVWLKLTSCQRQLYEAFLKSEWVDASMNGSPLAALTILKKICDHPLLLTKRAAEGILEGMDSMLNREELGMVEKMAKNLAHLDYENNDDMMADHNVSCKISFIISLLENLVAEGHLVLIFSQTRKMLNLIQEALVLNGYNFLRLDGTTKVSERDRIVKDFQEGPGAPIFLLTSQVGGLGLTLTKADRVIVVDPAWNPSTDNQSVDRAYRIGQKRDVIVYRLMTCGTIEEKIYKMQVFKGGLFRSATDSREQTRYFSQRDIRELFSIPKQGFDVSLTQQQLHEEHDGQHDMDAALTNHIKFLESQGIAGVSHHSLLFSKTATLPVVHDNIELPSLPVNKIMRGSSSSSSVERVVNGEAYAFNPKDPNFVRRSPIQTLTNGSAESPEQIEERIKRLSATLANKAVVSKLPDGGVRLQKQIDGLNTQLVLIRDSPQSDRPEKKDSEVICLDDLIEDFHKDLRV